MSDPNWEPAKTLAGDPHDDDGQVFEQLFEEQPNAVDTVGTGVVKPFVRKPPIRTTRLLTGFITIDSNSLGQPISILPVDHSRVSLHVRVDGTTGTDFVLVADDPGKFASQANSNTSGGAYKLIVDTGSPSIDAHTGSLWVYAKALTTPVTVSWAAVTL